MPKTSPGEVGKEAQSWVYHGSERSLPATTYEKVETHEVSLKNSDKPPIFYSNDKKQDQIQRQDQRK